MKIAILGTRGIPARYGGFETFAEELSTRLVDRGHQVWVTCRSHYLEPNRSEFRGVRLTRLPAIRTKYLETVSHTALSIGHALFQEYEILVVCNAVNAIFCGLPRVRGQKVILNVDGIERMRKKWSRVGRWAYRVSERLSTVMPDHIVADARVIQDYYRRRYNIRATYIPYGAETTRATSTQMLSKLGIEPGRYLLYVSRLEPENNAHLVMEAYLETSRRLPLVVVGDAPYSDRYKRSLQRLADQGSILMPGAIYGLPYRELLSHARCYFQATEVGGTHPALLEAMAVGALVVAHDTPENREVLADAGLLLDFYDRQSLTEIMNAILSDGDRSLDVGDRSLHFDDLQAKARERVRRHYDWDQVVDTYEALFGASVPSRMC